ncbi:MAG: hypothetical protein PVI21_00345 [Candidatus Woesebacteria bacterium]|jgi:hypothetical protein
MNGLIVISVLLVVLFAAAYFSKRRFGALGLALCAGALLSKSWASMLTPILESYGFYVDMPPLSVIVTVGLVLLPAIVLLFSGPSYKTAAGQIGGAIAFAVFAFVLIMDPLGAAINFDGITYNIYKVVTDYSTLIIAAAICLAIGDMLVVRTKHGKHGK